MKTQQKLNEYLRFTRKDRIAIIIIALILLTAFLLPPALEKQKATILPATDTAWMTALHQLERPAAEKLIPDYKKNDGNMSNENYARSRTAHEYNNGVGMDLFSFDPNTLDAAGWVKLGLRQKTAGTILKYLSKGGKFRKPEDLQRIYGLPQTQYLRLRPYIVIKETAPTPVAVRQPDREFTTITSAMAGKMPRVIEINTADSALLESLPGIGPTLTARIIRFREKLGGFYSVEQLRETFGLADSVFQKIKPYLRNDDQEIKKIDLNKAGLEELKAHPYVRYNIANAIIQYRNQHGFFKAPGELKKIMVIDNSTYEKLKPYFFVTE